MRLTTALFLFMSLLAGSLMARDETTMYGFVEKATLVDKNITVSAKLDTGAKSASLNATSITPFKKEGETYLRFIIPLKQGEVPFEAKYIGRVKIKSRENENGTAAPYSTFMKRPVVLIKIKLGEQTMAIPVNLTNRKRFIYPLLLGRDAIIQFNGAVNPAATFLHSKSAATHEKQ